MAIPYMCSECGELVGIESETMTLARAFSKGAGTFDSRVSTKCPGQGNHPLPKVTATRRLFGLLKNILVEYPETYTSSSWEAYSGPPNKFWLWFAIVFGSGQYPNGWYRGVTVNGKWVWWGWDTGFYGDGIDELPKLKNSKKAV